MTNPNKAAITLVLDRSGSMGSIRDDTIGGVNTFIVDQRKQPGECTFTLAQFDDVYEVVMHNKPLADVALLTRETFVPRGSTALLDAIGKTINVLGAELAALPETQRPGKVYFVVMTDGQENASREFDRDQVFKMIQHQRDNYKWEFVFLGANQDAIQAGTSLGFLGSHSVSYASNSGSVAGSYGILGKKLSAHRATGKALDFDEQDRKEAMGQSS